MTKAVMNTLAKKVYPQVRGKFIFLGEQKFYIKGVTYGSFAPNSEGEPYPEIEQVRDDFAQMAEAGINTVRLYSPPSDRIADAAAEAGLKLIPDICWGPRICPQLESEQERHKMSEYAISHAKRLRDHPAILMFSIGNEIPPLVIRWFGRNFIQQHLQRLYNEVKNVAPDSLITYANHPPAEHLNLAFLDVVAFNVYLEQEAEYRAYLARLQSLAGDRPLFISELGLDAGRSSLEEQGRYLEQFLRATFAKGLCGATVYSWTDEWSIFDHQIQGWSFGLTTKERQSKPALLQVSQIFSGDLYSLRQSPWTPVSVVVASYNGAKTLPECLDSLLEMNYPNYEIIVVDDGSTDGTEEILQHYPTLKKIPVPTNGGLSRARNLGLEAARGEIVAFIDADAYADPDWLYYMVTALEEQEAAGVGGPNLSPPQDNFIAQCVDHAPGNPTHVLLNDELAEHVPGCNMAFRKSALLRLGNFDPTHRAAGDDIDVCWKLLAAEEKIAFAPAAVVWHHRRKTVRSFLKQQEGYGYAEAFVSRRYPSRFNLLGDLVWHGSIYDGVNVALRREGVPSLLKPRIYQGFYGSAGYQGLYQPFRNWWFQIFTTFEWQGTAVLVIISSLLAAISAAKTAAAGLAILAIIMLLLTLGAAWLAAVHASLQKRWSAGQKQRGQPIVAFLHLAQPLARAKGRLRGWWRSRPEQHDYPAVARLWGNLEQRDRWLKNLQTQLALGGWQVEPASEWDRSDIKVSGPGPCRAELISVYEDYLEKGFHFVRYRVEVRWKMRYLILGGLIAAATVSLFFVPYLLPLSVVPITFLLLLVQFPSHLERAISQAAQDVGIPLGMTEVEEKYIC